MFFRKTPGRNPEEPAAHRPGDPFAQDGAQIVGRAEIAEKLRQVLPVRDVGVNGALPRDGRREGARCKKEDEDNGTPRPCLPGPGSPVAVPEGSGLCGCRPAADHWVAPFALPWRRVRSSERTGGRNPDPARRPCHGKRTAREEAAGPAVSFTISVQNASSLTKRSMMSSKSPGVTAPAETVR